MTISGWLTDRYGARPWSFALDHMQCAVPLGVSFVIMAVPAKAIPLYAAALLFGLSYGGTTGPTAATLAGVMGVAHFRGTRSTLMTSRAVGILFGLWCAVLGAAALSGFTAPSALRDGVLVVAAWMLQLERASVPA